MTLHSIRPAPRRHRPSPWMQFGLPLLGLAALWFFWDQTPLLFTSLIVSWGLFYVLNPMVDYLEGHALNRMAASATVMVGLVLAMWLAWSNLVGLAVDLRDKIDMDVFQKNLLVYAERVILRADRDGPLIHQYFERRALKEAPSPSAAAPSQGGMPEELDRRLKEMLDRQVVELVPRVLKTLAGFLPNLILIPYFTFFFLKDGRQFKKTIVSWIPNRFFEASLKFLYEMDRNIRSYLQGTLLDCMLVGLFVGVGCALVGAPYPLVFGIISGVLNSIPLLGPMLYGGVCLLLIIGAGKPATVVPVVFGFSGVFVLSRIFDDLIVTPAIFGKSHHLHAIAVVCVVLLGSAIAGAWGMFLAIPVTSIVFLAIRIIREISLGEETKSTLHSSPAPFT